MPHSLPRTSMLHNPQYCACQPIAHPPSNPLLCVCLCAGALRGGACAEAAPGGQVRRGHCRVGRGRRRHRGGPGGRGAAGGGAGEGGICDGKGHDPAGGALAWVVWCNVVWWLCGGVGAAGAVGQGGV